MPRRSLSLLLLLLAPACAHYPVNAPLDMPLDSSMGYRFETLATGPANTDATLVCVTFSGGGARAGAMAYGVVRTLAETRISGGRTLADEVDVISSASGGSFPAAYLGAFGHRKFLANFRETVLQRDLGMETFWEAALCPYNFVRICSPWFNRSDLASELYDRTIFEDLTYASLQSKGRPFVVLNATDMLEGKRFEFTQDQFDTLGSSLSPIKLARAVAASAAFPVLLTPVAFRNYNTPQARYVHLIDGGLVDNLGLGYVLESYQRGAIHDLIVAGKVERVVFVVVNARNRVPEDLSASSQAPGAGTALVYGLDAAIDRRADDQTRLLAELCARGVIPEDGDAPEVHYIEVDLDDLPDPVQRERLLGVETTFGLPEETLDELVEASAQLLELNPVFKHVRDELQAPLYKHVQAELREDARPLAR
ncbi:MAG: patatin-like phospholipase family protein [Planctomycetes bacterium]|nr:patatin-like phospholipase family protein [Planctomycetota bacterium]